MNAHGGNLVDHLAPRVTALAVFLLAYLVLLGWGFALYRTQAQHPSHWPVSLISCCMAASFCAQTYEVVRAFSRQEKRLRWKTLTRWLTMITLLSGLGLMVSYVLAVTSTKSIPDNLALRWCASMGSAIADLEKNLRYRHRYVGQRVELYSTQPISSENAWSLVSQADAHLEAMERDLGSPMTTRVHWIRGSILGRNNCQFLGLAMSDPEIDSETGRIPFTDLDRHELAHFAIHGRVTANFMPPFVLVEGWAQAKSGMNRETLYRDAWQTRQNGAVPWQLDQLIRRPYYESDQGPVYSIGGALVDYLLRNYGAAKFRDLYLNAQQATFAAQFQKVYGTTLSHVEDELWRDIDDLMSDRKNLAFWVDPDQVPANVDASLWREVAQNTNQHLPMDWSWPEKEIWKIEWLHSKDGAETERGESRYWWGHNQWWRHRRMEVRTSTGSDPKEELIGIQSDEEVSVVLERNSEDDPWKPRQGFDSQLNLKGYVTREGRNDVDSVRNAIHPAYFLSAENMALHDVTQVVDRVEGDVRRVEFHLRYRESKNRRCSVLTLGPEWQWQTVRFETAKDDESEPDQRMILEWQKVGEGVRLKRRWSEGIVEDGAKIGVESTFAFDSSSDMETPWSMNELPRQAFSRGRTLSRLEWFFMGLTSLSVIATFASGWSARAERARRAATILD